MRTALYCRLLARKTDGIYKLRIEDTDRARSTKVFENDILDAFHWFGLDWDAGPGKDDGKGPYHQMERLDIYNEYVQDLLDSGKAYYAWETAEELEEMRKEADTKKHPFRYRKIDYTDEQIAEFKEE